MNIEEAIEILKEIQETNRAWLKETEEEICEKIYLKDIEAIETVLNYIETMHKEFDRLEGIEDNTAMLKYELEKKDKVIDEILNKFIEGTEYYYSEFDYMSKEEIKEYFYKKASEEDDAVGR